jgi:hypothetical protein
MTLHESKLATLTATGDANSNCNVSATGTGTLTLDSATGAIAIGSSANARSISLGNVAAPQAVTIGSTDTTSSLALNAGSNNVTITSPNIAANGNIRQTTNASTISGRNAANSADVEIARVDASDRVSIAQGGADMLLGSGAVTWSGAANKALSLGATGTGTVDLQSATGQIRIGSTNSARSVALGTGAAAQTVTVGSTNSTSSLTFNYGTAGSNFAQGAATSGTPNPWTFTGAAHSGIANAETIDADYNLARTVTFSGGGAALTNQRAVRIQAPTYAAAAAQTIGLASTVEIVAAPTQGANVTFSAVGVSTGAYALNVASGNARFGGSVYVRDTNTGPGTQGLYVTDSSGNGYRWYQYSSTIAWLDTVGSATSIMVSGSIALRGPVNSFADKSYDIGSTSARMRDFYNARTLSRNHSAFTGSEAVRDTGAVQTTGVTTSAVYTLAIPDNSGTSIEARIVARDTASSARAMWVIAGGVYRQGGGAATMIGSSVSLTNQTTGAPANTWTATITVSGNNALISVTGSAGLTVNWAASVDYQSVIANT